MQTTEKIKIGVSACLLGKKVRYDGGHQHDRFISETLGYFFDFIPVCPEVECGLPVPREAMHLAGGLESPRLLTTRTGIDHTERMQRWAADRLDSLAGQNLGGFIFKSKSPSSGMERVKVRDDDGKVRNNGVGLFARAFMERFPLLPVEDDGRLHDLPLRENFIECVFLYQRWRKLRDEEMTRGGLVGFHSDHKLLLLAHDEKIYRQLGRLVAQSKEYSVEALFLEYEQQMVKAMRLLPTIKKHCNVLMHMMGYFKKVLSINEKHELLGTIEQYRNNLLPLIVPVTLLNHYVRKYNEPYLARQYYLQPHPLELKLRNHA
ncbi:MAG: DUF523 and DUF1722 domain-containing protein [Desulfobulbaceae bacterium]|nr:DUF523 and DUF1722 domain-containing protein [Desulfobulbaceae bacterium]